MCFITAGKGQKHSPKGWHAMIISQASVEPKVLSEKVSKKYWVQAAPS
jgi:hypothetical protein